MAPTAVDLDTPGALYVERLGMPRRAWGLFVFALVVTAFAIHPLYMPFVALAWAVSVLRYNNTGVRIDHHALTVGRRSTLLATLDLATLGQARNPWPWKVFSRRYLGANPVWTRESIRLRGQTGGKKVIVAIGTNRRDELLGVLGPAVTAAKRAGPWGPPPWVPSPSWYPDPFGPSGCVRWWDGTRWTPFVARPHERAP
ncbi:MAG: DUF2510 domain-containing protein [Acidimicrobiales bacterium]